MEQSGVMKMEDLVGSWSFSGHAAENPAIFGFSDEVEKGNIGFMELLSVPNFESPLFDLVQLPGLENPAGEAPLPPVPASPPEVVNPPATPNSSSMSSASSHEHSSKAVEEEEDEEEKKTKKE